MCKPKSEETKKNMSKSKSDEHRKNISTARKGMTFSDEHKYKMSEAQKGKNKGSKNYRYAPFTINNIKYETLPEAAEVIGCAHQTIWKRLKNPNFPEYVYI